MLLWESHWGKWRGDWRFVSVWNIESLPAASRPLKHSTPLYSTLLWTPSRAPLAASMEALFYGGTHTHKHRLEVQLQSHMNRVTYTRMKDKRKHISGETDVHEWRIHKYTKTWNDECKYQRKHLQTNWCVLMKRWAAHEHAPVEVHLKHTCKQENHVSSLRVITCFEMCI